MSVTVPSTTPFTYADSDPAFALYTSSSSEVATGPVVTRITELDDNGGGEIVFTVAFATRSGDAPSDARDRVFAPRPSGGAGGSLMSM